MDTPILDDPEDGKPHDEVQFAALMREAHELGLHYTGRDCAELELILTLARQERGVSHPVPCYGLSYEPTDRRCRVCQLRGPCAELDKRPRVEVLDPNQLEAVLCESCGRGELRVELRAPESELVRDYGCTTPGCLNTLGVQCGWSEEKRRAVPTTIAFEAKPKEKLEGVIQPPEPTETPKPAPAKKRPRVVIKEDGAAPTPDVAAHRVELAEATMKKKVEATAGGRPKLRSIAGGKAAPPKKAEPKKAEPKKAPAKKAEPKKAEAPEKPPKNGAGKVAFRYGGELYDNLTKVATVITESRNWSGAKFFQVDPSELRAGSALQREWKGQVITVEVVRAKE